MQAVSTSEGILAGIVLAVERATAFRVGRIVRNEREAACHARAIDGTTACQWPAVWARLREWLVVLRGVGSDGNALLAEVHALVAVVIVIFRLVVEAVAIVAVIWAAPAAAIPAATTHAHATQEAATTSAKAPVERIANG